jgi:dTDP-4-amino-4,6-dideoxy-D-galactose acyltransferase
MTDVCAHLTWDTDFFGFPVARVRAGALNPALVGQIDEWCSAHQTKLLYYLADDDPPSWASAAEAGFRLVDLRVELVLDRTWPRLPPSLPNVDLREAVPDDLEALLPIAATVHTDSRFFTDERISRDKAHEMFAFWLRRSVERAIADVVFVADVDGRAVAYLSAKCANGVGNIGLVGVGEAARGRGVGLSLVQRAIEWFSAQGANEVTVVTQGRNIMAQRVYQRCGFLTRSTRLWFHRWY